MNRREKKTISFLSTTKNHTTIPLQNLSLQAHKKKFNNNSKEKRRKKPKPTNNNYTPNQNIKYNSLPPSPPP